MTGIHEGDEMAPFEQLKRLRDPDWVKKRIAAFGDLHQTRLAALKRILRRPSSDYYAREHERGAAVRELLKDCDGDERRRVFGLLFPRLVDEIDRVWRTIAEVPLSNGHSSLWWRVPHRLDLVEARRASFFSGLCLQLRGYDPDAEWVARWGPIAARSTPVHHGSPIVWIIAAALSGPNADEVRSILHEQLRGESDDRLATEYVIITMLNSEHREDWETVGELLVSAQRQEGLRSAICSVMHEGRQDAFRYMLGLVHEHDLLRFSGVESSFSNWTEMTVAEAGPSSDRAMRRVLDHLDDPELRQASLAGDEPRDVYMALWATAQEDATEAMRLAGVIVEDEDASTERRFVAACALYKIGLEPDIFEIVDRRLISGAEDDPRVLLRLVESLGSWSIESRTASNELFESLVQIYESIPKQGMTLEPLIWPDEPLRWSRNQVLTVMKHNSRDDAARLGPYIQELDWYDCVQVISRIARVDCSTYTLRSMRKRPTVPPSRRQLSQAEQDVLVTLSADRRREVHCAAFEGLRIVPPDRTEMERLIELMSRQSATLRTCAIDRLAMLPDELVVEAVTTLLEQGNAKRRAAGLELAIILCDMDREAAAVRSSVAERRDRCRTVAEKALLDQLVNPEQEDDLRQETALGLAPPELRTAPIEIKRAELPLRTKAARKCVRSLAELLLRHADDEIEIAGDEETIGVPRRMLLSEAAYSFPLPTPAPDMREAARARLPLADVWLKWIDERPEQLRDADGLELIRAFILHDDEIDRKSTLPKELREHSWALGEVLSDLLRWAISLTAVPGGGAFLVQLAENLLAANQDAFDPDARAASRRRKRRDPKTTFAWCIARCISMQRMAPAMFTADDRVRMGALPIIALEIREAGADSAIAIEHIVEAYEADVLNVHDIMWMLLCPRGETIDFEWGPDFDDDGVSRQHARFMRSFLGVRPHPAVQRHEALLRAAETVRRRVVEVESKRGEKLGPASSLAEELTNTGGAEALFHLLTVLGRDKLRRNAASVSHARVAALSRLITVTWPTEDDTPASFRERYEQSDIKQNRLVEVAFFAPKWSGHIGHALGIRGLDEAAWWVHAHTKQGEEWDRDGLREQWAAQIAQRTALGARDLEDGAVDVAWFDRVLKTVGRTTWASLQKAAIYASKSGGHKRAQLFAAALLGDVEANELIERIDDKRHQDSVRALGLVPLPRKKSEARAETLRRYERLEAFRKESRKFGSQRQASERRAIEIGLQNLARTAGYRDPRHLQWAMESEAVADLARGPVEVSIAETTVTLSINEDGEPQLSVRKQDKKLKNVPAKLRKHEPIAALKSRLSDLRQQRSRMRLSLEASMCRGDVFSGSDLRTLCKHPMLRPSIERLVLVGDGDRIGYPAESGRLLVGLEGVVEPVGARDALRIAHPTDLLERGDWSRWQRDCFRAERVQPFKQVFREAYTKIASELEGENLTRRYAGHQVNPRQALALLRTREWVFAPEEGCRHVFHDEGLSAELWFQEHFYTPAEIEGLTLEGVAFARLEDSTRHVPITDIPDRIFSETMRDLDLVVSVAHMGGVDPEASPSTIEMREALLRETCQLLRLDNVRIEGSHAHIDGTRASYSLHLGSAITHVKPGRMLVIVAVHSQHRGRLFLPFADDDPKTAEVLSKALLLARDDTIKDPGILEQIHR